MTEPSDTYYALGAFGSGELLGVASHYVETATTGRAEVVVVVAHSQHLRGVGTALLCRLAVIAQERGGHHFVAEALAENHPMHRVSTDSGGRALDTSTDRSYMSTSILTPSQNRHWPSAGG